MPSILPTDRLITSAGFGLAGGISFRMHLQSTPALDCFTSICNGLGVDMAFFPGMFLSKVQ